MREGGGGSAAARAPAPCGRSPARLRPLREGSPLPSPLASPGPLGHPPPSPLNEEIPLGNYRRAHNMVIVN